jgi:hypothetical protein
MNRQAPEIDLRDVDRLGEPRLVCHTSRKTLFWGFLVAVVPGVLGAAALCGALRLLLGGWSEDVLGLVLLLAVGVGSLWAARALWSKTSRLRHVQVAVHAGGLSYRDDSTCLAWRWDEILDIRWSVSLHRETTSFAVGGVLPVPGTTVETTVHRSHQVIVRRMDGAQLVFTDELENITEMPRAIQEAASRNAGGESLIAEQDRAPEAGSRQEGLG